MSRTVVLSTSDLNRQGFRMLTSGVELDAYRRNPVLLWMHTRADWGKTNDVLPIGTVENIRIEGDRLLGELQFDEVDEFSRTIAQKWDKGTLRSVSVGANAIEESVDPKVVLPGQRYATVTRWELIEVSVADIPANPYAVRLSRRGKGIMTMQGEDVEKILTPINTKENKMEQIALKLGLPAESGEAEILRKIEELQLRATESQEQLEKLEQLAISQVVDAAITECRITELQRNHFLELGKKVGLGDLKLTLSAISPAVKVSQMLSIGKGQATTHGKKWRELSEQELKQLRLEDFEQYAALYKAEYGIEPAIK